MTENEQWQWQESGHAWHGVGIYHVTLTVPSRQPLLGTLVIPDNNPALARVERSEMGRRLVGVLGQISKYHPEIRLLRYAIMPDHLHAVLYVTRTMPKGIMSVVRGIWQGAKKVGREYVLSVSPNSIRDNKQYTNSIENVNPIFTEMPFVRPMSRHGQLKAMMRYVEMNPQRLATKRLMPRYFCVQHDIVIGGQTYDGIGNIALLQAEKYMPVHVRHTLVEAADRGEATPLRDYMNSCVLAARKGTVMVSPFISPQEREVLTVLMKEQRPVIVLADNGFGDYYKPSDNLFEACASGHLLILSPWLHDTDKRHITRAECVELNLLAEKICETL